MTHFDPTILHDLPTALRREWLETDGLGGFAMGTIVGANTRRYHGLLVAATEPPVGRRVLVAKLEERLLAGGPVCELGCNEYEGAVHPQGYRCLEEFRLDPWPIFTWVHEGFRLRKSVFMPHRLGLTLVRYDLLDAPRATWLHARPLIAGRDMHHLHRSSGDLNAHVEHTGHRLAMQPYDPASRLTLDFPHGEFRADGVWYYNFHYAREQERGLDCVEDLYSPGEIVWLMRPGETVWLVLSRDGAPAGFDGEQLMAAERERRAALAKPFRNDAVAARLAVAADQFIVDRTVRGVPGKTIIAGYPWFGDWGRDTMIALFGLTLTTKRYEDCRAMLRAFIAEMRGGLVPNLFVESGDPSYNTVDATLWLFVAMRRYLQATRDTSLLAEVWPALRESLEAHIAGTDYGIRMTEDGLLTAGDESTQLTWMDAKVDDWVVTPRHGKAVEINGLWYNALRIGAFLADKLDDAAVARYTALAQRTRAGFAQFWHEAGGYCYDILRPDGPDAALRPNQLIACALPYHVLSPAQRRSILAQATAHLLTPYGLRTLAPGSEGYRPHYGGDRWARDGAYHQGTAWPWLLGPYLTTWFDVMGVTDETRREARALLQPLLAHLDDAGLGSISEIFDAEDPYAPHGCPAQAWSVGELLRCWVQYKLGS
ncbi:MAG: amylo-alpha-1,6-glucosidase [Armatimonadetes bacterium]|nr:amylo-alpha-1,6-glucosidase [Armatimonadota bacterium]